jgi:hypothetical protein
MSLPVFARDLHACTLVIYTDRHVAPVTRIMAAALDIVSAVTPKRVLLFLQCLYNYVEK